MSISHAITCCPDPPVISVGSSKTIQSLLTYRLYSMCFRFKKGRTSHNSAPSIDQCFRSNISEPGSPANVNIIPYHPPKCDPYSIQTYFPPAKSSSETSSNYSKIIESSTTSSSINGISQFSEGTIGSLDGSSYPHGQILETPNLKEFTFADLKTATKNFRSDSLLGEGGFGRVFEGWMDEKTLAPSRVGTGMIVAIKELSPETMQGFQEWQSEVNFLGGLSHPNLVKLLGYCWEDKELLLVYEFPQKRSLENHLFRRNPNIEPLSWDLRLQIAIGAARGLTFLHALEKRLIYRDFKASNILLDANYNAKISDVGLAKLVPSAGDDSHVTTRVMGTYGYAAPEYIATGHLYAKSDVYGFGVVLLEMLSGLQAVDTNRPKRRQNLVDWLKPLLSNKRKLKTIMDVRMEGQYSSKSAIQAAQLTIKCLESDPRTRPSMKDVVEALERIELTKEKSKESKITHFIAHGHGQQPIHHHSPLHVGNHGAES